MFLLVELKTATLDYGIPGVSAMRMLLMFWMMLAISMIPYLFLYLSLRERRAMEQRASMRVRGFAAWLDVHRPHLLHH